MLLRIIPKAVWLDNLKVYYTGSFNIDDIKVHVYENTTLRGQVRSGQFFITDIRVKQEQCWTVAGRPEREHHHFR